MASPVGEAHPCEIGTLERGGGRFEAKAYRARRARSKPRSRRARLRPDDFDLLPAAHHEKESHPEISRPRLWAGCSDDGPVIHGIGIDLVEVARFEDKTAAGGPGFLEAMFHPAEIAYCRAMRNPWPCFAARFAAKEALFKALGTLGAGAVSWREVEVVHGADGRPSLVLRGETARVAEERRVARVHLSLTHEESCVAALAVIEVD